MESIRTVLCPVDFGRDTDRQIELAVELCRLFGARLVVHHNLLVTPMSTVGWMWAEEHRDLPSRADGEERLTALLGRVPADIAAEARITRGLPTQAVLAVRTAVEADLVVLATHGATTDDHTSLTEQVLERGCPLLALHDGGVDHAAPVFRDGAAQRALVATDLTAESCAAVELACALARKLPLELHLLYVEPGGHRTSANAAEARLSALVPGDLASRARLHLEQGDPGSAIAAAAERLGASLVVMGEHTRAPWRRWWSRDTSLAVLRSAHCPIWFVPGSAAAAQA